MTIPNFVKFLILSLNILLKFLYHTHSPLLKCEREEIVLIEYKDINLFNLLEHMTIVRYFNVSSKKVCADVKSFNYSYQLPPNSFSLFFRLLFNILIYRNVYCNFRSGISTGVYKFNHYFSNKQNHLFFNHGDRSLFLDEKEYYNCYSYVYTCI